MPDLPTSPERAFYAWSPGPVLGGSVGAVVDYRMPADPGRVHRGMPGPWLTMVVSYRDTVPVLSAADDGYTRADHRALVGGLHRRASLLPQDDPQWGVQIDIAPLAAPALFGVTAAELAGQVADLHDFLGRGADDLADALAETRPGPERFGMIRTALASRLSGATPAARAIPELKRAWQLIVGSHGRMPVATVAAEVGWSRRHLADRMRRSTGLTPKDLAQNVRFQRSRRLILARAGSLADIAVHCGYADQSHLTAQWRDLAGCTPGAWIAEELPSMADFPVAHDDVDVGGHLQNS